MNDELTKILAENELRLSRFTAPFNPITGDGSIGERVELHISDFCIPSQFVPKEMFYLPIIKKISKAGSISTFVKKEFNLLGKAAQEIEEKVSEQLIRLRCLYDFPFWAAAYVYIKNKDGGEDVLLRLNPPQRQIVERFERARLADKPIRLLILKARQLGGSTLIQVYMAWLQLLHRRGLNSLIISLQSKASDEIYDMYDRLIKSYPVWLLHELGETYNKTEAKFVGVGTSGAIHRVPQRGCKIKIGSAEKPDSCRGGDYSLVHLSEVGLFKKTDGKSPEDIVQSACSGVLLKPYTMIVYESTARGTGNFFHKEYTAAKAGRSQFEALCIRWFDIPQWSLPFEKDEDRAEFARTLYNNKENSNAPSDREETGKYLWWLWEQGATLEAINWYIKERRGRSSHTKMSSEYPSDDVEAFTDIDTALFDRYQVERLKPACRPPKYVGDVYGKADEGEDALADLRFTEDSRGKLWVWALPEFDPEEEVADRYLVVVDIGGHSDKADWSVICVFDRVMMIDGGKPSVVAQWYGHTDMDLLAWRAAQIAAYYDNALLVIESNTLETHDREREVDGDQSHFILNLIKDVYPNLYARKQSEEDIREGRPRKYGFHTNVATKPMVISTLKKVVREGLYVERDERCLHELLVYERKPNGSFGAIAGDHDDLLMTRAIGLHICLREMELPRVRKRNDGSKFVLKKAVSEATL